MDPNASSGQNQNGSLSEALKELKQFLATTLASVGSVPTPGEKYPRPKPFPHGLGELSIELRSGAFSVRLELKDAQDDARSDHFIVPMTYYNGTGEPRYVQLVGQAGSNTILIPANTHGTRDLGNANEAGTTVQNVP